MADDQERDQWSVVVAYLEQARRALPDPSETMLGSYREYVDHDELGLAFECLVVAASAQRAARQAWESLRAAANAMELDEKSYPHGEWVASVSRHLAE
jgi:hypothetical protein